jgi:glyoxylase I family protein
MNVKNIDHVNLRVPVAVMEELKEFYCSVLGLKVGWRPPFASIGYWLYAGESPVVHLVERKPDEAPFDAGARAAIDHVALQCSGRHALIARLQELGIPFAVSEVPQVGDIQIFIHDPAGTGVELTFRPE